LDKQPQKKEPPQPRGIYSSKRDSSLGVGLVWLVVENKPPFGNSRKGIKIYDEGIERTRILTLLVGGKECFNLRNRKGSQVVNNAFRGHLFGFSSLKYTAGANPRTLKKMFEKRVLGEMTTSLVRVL